VPVADIGDGEQEAEIGQRQAEDDGLVKQRVPLKSPGSCH